MKITNVKNFVLGTVFGVVVASSIGFAAGQWVEAYQDYSMSIKFDGVKQEFYEPNDGSAVYPLIYNNRTYLPLRAVSDLTGMYIDFDDATRTVLLNTEKVEPDVNEGELINKPVEESGEKEDSIFVDIIGDLNLTADPNLSGYVWRDDISNLIGVDSMKGYASTTLGFIHNGAQSEIQGAHSKSPYKEELRIFQQKIRDLKTNYQSGYDYTFVFDEDDMEVVKVGTKPDSSLVDIAIVKVKAKVYTDYSKTNLYREEVIHVLMVQDDAQGYPHFYCNVEI